MFVSPVLTALTITVDVPGIEKNCSTTRDPARRKINEGRITVTKGISAFLHTYFLNIFHPERPLALAFIT